MVCRDAAHRGSAGPGGRRKRRPQEAAVEDRVGRCLGGQSRSLTFATRAGGVGTYHDFVKVAAASGAVPGAIRSHDRGTGADALSSPTTGTEISDADLRQVRVLYLYGGQQLLHSRTSRESCSRLRSVFTNVGSSDVEQGVPSVEIIIRERGGEARRADADHADHGRLGQTRDKDTNVPENSATFELWAQRAVRALRGDLRRAAPAGRQLPRVSRLAQDRADVLAARRSRRSSRASCNASRPPCDAGQQAQEAARQAKASGGAGGRDRRTKNKEHFTPDVTAGNTLLRAARAKSEQVARPQSHVAPHHSPTLTLLCAGELTNCLLPHRGAATTSASRRRGRSLPLAAPGGAKPNCRPHTGPPRRSMADGPASHRRSWQAALGRSTGKLPRSMARLTRASPARWAAGASTGRGARRPWGGQVRTALCHSNCMGER